MHSNTKHTLRKVGSFLATSLSLLSPHTASKFRLYQSSNKPETWKEITTFFGIQILRKAQMFYLSEIEHTFRLPPHLLDIPLEEAIKLELEKIFLDKVIAKLGLCISVYDIRSIKGGFIFPGDGASTYTVVFRLIVFRPFVGEIISAKLKESDANGLRLTLGFFYDIYIPVHLLPNPSRFEPDPDYRNRVRWIWEYEGENFIIDGIDQIKFRVHSVSYPPIPVEQPDQSKPFAPMVITGSIDSDGLGPVSWWDNAEQVTES